MNTFQSTYLSYSKITIMRRKSKNINKKLQKINNKKIIKKNQINKRDILFRTRVLIGCSDATNSTFGSLQTQTQNHA